MSSSEEMLFIVRLGDQATKPLAALKGLFGQVTGEAKGTSAGVQGLRGRIDELATGGKLGGFIQDLALGRSATASLRDALGRVRGEEQALDRDTKSLGDRFRDLGNWIRAGLGIDIGMTIGRTIRGWIDDLIHAIPNAIVAGRAYAQMIDDIRDETGMTAQQASILVGLFERTGIEAGQLDRIFAMFGRNLIQNEEIFRSLGIATRDSNGHFLDAYTIITNTRRAFAEHGAQLASTGAAQELFSRTGYKLLDFLQLSDAQVKVYTDDLARMGLVLDDATTQGAERFGRELARVGQALSGLQVTIFAALGPSLEHFVDAFAGFIRDNLREIVSFVVNVANFVMGVIGGLLGLDFAARTTESAVSAAGAGADRATGAWAGLEDQQKASGKAADALTTSLEGQIKAVDRQIEAIRRRAEARQSANQREQLALDLQRAQMQLDDLRGNKPYVEGLSNAEQQLALQKHAQDIVDAQKAVADARKSLSGFDLDQGDKAQIDALQRRRDRYQAELEAHRKKVSAQAALETGLKGTTISIDDALVAKSDAMYADITKAAEAWRDQGIAFAGDLRGAFDGLLDVILGKETTSYLGGGSMLVTTRSGGLIGALGGVGGMMDLARDKANGLADALRVLVGFSIGLVTAYNWLSDVLRPVRDLVADLAAAVGNLSGPLGDLLDTVLGFMRSLPGFGLFIPDTSHPGRAGGGGAAAGVMYRVNERGPDEEFFVPSTNGSIVPAGGNGGRMIIETHAHLHLDGREIARVVDRIFADDAGNSPIPLALSGAG